MVFGCSSCSHTDCPLADHSCTECPQGKRLYTGWAFSIICTLVFLMPILLAVLGSFMLKGSKTDEMLGGVGGFLIGFILSSLITKVACISKSN
jgi:zinc transporter ZupT